MHSWNKGADAFIRLQTILLLGFLLRPKNDGVFIGKFKTNTWFLSLKYIIKHLYNAASAFGIGYVRIFHTLKEFPCLK